MRKPFFCICENKDADQLRGNREADLRLWLSHMQKAGFLKPWLPSSGTFFCEDLVMKIFEHFSSSNDS